MACARDISFEVVQEESVSFEYSGPSPWSLTSKTTTTMPDVVLVTGASQLYYDQGRLQNLIGSIHFWEPSTKIEFYNLGLNKETLADIRTWKNVVVREMLLEGLPPHVGDWGKYAFKPVVMEDALQRHEAIFWVDANAELRKPMDEIR